jgi:hypothetical protein
VNSFLKGFMANRIGSDRIAGCFLPFVEICYSELPPNRPPPQEGEVEKKED